MAQEKKGGEVAKVDAGAWYYPVAAARLQDLRRQIIGAIADKLSGNNDDSKLHSLPNAVQVLVDAPVGSEAGDPIPLALAVMARGGRGRGGSLSVVLGIIIASSAVTALADGAVSTAVAFGFFFVLLGGLALAMASVRT